jgi:hypothetical protein
MPRAAQTDLVSPRRRFVTTRSRAWAVLLSAGLTVGLVTITPPADAAVTQSATCADEGGIRWSSRAIWGDTYVDAEGDRRVSVDYVGWTTTKAGTVPTDSSVRTYDGNGTRLQSLDWTGVKDYGSEYESRNPMNPVSSPGKSKITVTLGLDGDGLGDCTVTFTQPSTGTAAPVRSAITNLPGQPAITAYDSSSAITPFAHEGALIVAGRDNYADQATKAASETGATVLIYFDAVIDNPSGRYHQMLNQQSVCGPATSRWPGNYRANSWGYLNDFRVGSVLQSKVKCVLEKMVAENPHMGGFFADDLGSRSWFPGFSWENMGTANQQAYREGAIALAQTIHDVAVEHGLMVMVNGTWTAGSLASNGGGYPSMSRHGLSLADGGYIEQHDIGELKFWTAYAQGQWATAPGSVGQDQPFMYVQARDSATRDAYNKAGVFAFLSAQQQYDTASVWGSFHATGLPSGVSE